MKQLGTLDSAFINLETRNTPQHIGGLGIYDPSTAAGGAVRFKEVLDSFELRLNSMPLFRTRLVQVPGDIDKPYWVEDANFDVEFHIRHISLPKPGDWRQLWIQAARLHSRPLDMARPLWEVYVIEGLDNFEGLPEGAFAMYTKMHHSMVDGAGGASFMAALHDLEPNPAPQAATAQTILVDRDPSGAELLARGVINNVTGSFGKLRSVANAAAGLAKYQLGVSRDELPPLDIQGPETRFNKQVGPHRIAEGATFALADIKSIKNAAGVTINDVVLGLVGGALQRYLKLHNEVPGENLVAAIPVNLRVRKGESTENNNVGSMFADLHSNVEDPIERLKAIRETTRLAKSTNSKNPMSEALRVAGFFSPLVSKAAAQFWSRNHLSQYLPTNVSTVITNVPGPNFSMYCAGAEMVRYHGLGLLTPGCGVFHAVFSSNGRVTVTVLSDREIIPDPEVYRQCLLDSHADMLQAAETAEEKTRKEAQIAKKSAKDSSPVVKDEIAEKKKAGKKKASGSRKPVKTTKAGKIPKKSTEAKSEKLKPLAKAKPKAKAEPTIKARLGKNVRPMTTQAASRPKRSLRDLKIPESAKRTTTSTRTKAPKKRTQAS